MNILANTIRKHFATLAIVEHNGKTLTKNTLKLLNASSKLKDEVPQMINRPIYLSVDNIPNNYWTTSNTTLALMSLKSCGLPLKTCRFVRK